MRRFLTAVAGIALVAGAAQVHAQGNGKGGDKGGGKPAAAAMQGGGQGPGRGKGGGNGSAMREQGGGQSMAQSMRASEAPGNGRGEQGGKPDKAGERGQGSARAGDNRIERAAGRGRGNDTVVEIDRRGRGNDDRLVVVDDRGRGSERGFAGAPPRGLIDGCPPGLAKKRNGCQPPGQVRNAYAWDGFARPDWWGLRGLDSGRYFYRDGYLMRYDGDRIGGYVPLLGGALGVGNVWPSFYEPVRLPQYYESYYALGPYDSYRYADDVIYRVDPDTAAITSVAALLTGDPFAVGQPLPLGYDVYNVPYGYRDRYLDGPDALYRYSDGYVYEVDPTTRLITAAIELLT